MYGKELVEILIDFFEGDEDKAYATVILGNLAIILILLFLVSLVI